MTDMRDQNISTEHQTEGDARRPQDTLDRDQQTEGELKPEATEGRSSVGTVTPDGYSRDRPDR
ncbi:MAG: hypothetical protein EON59_00360 [Alphaproteobacteria bacterium]|nr:MAG: hypothetical protein EON59_00360 [Alphaproteobacteria bacterium]